MSVVGYNGWPIFDSTYRLDVPRLDWRGLARENSAQKMASSAPKRCKEHSADARLYSLCDAVNAILLGALGALTRCKLAQLTVTD